MDTLNKTESNEDLKVPQEDHSLNKDLDDEELNKKCKEFLNAIRTENTELIDKIIDTYQEKYDIINRVDPETGQTSIYLAAIQNSGEASLNITKLLISKGANILYKDNYSQTAFFHVVREGKVGLIDLYVQNGADVNEQDDFKQTPLFYAARDGKSDAVKKMCERNANTNILDKVNQNALFYGASANKIDVCKILLEHDVDVNQYDNKKQTALFFAKKKGHTAIADLLIQNGAINTKDGKYSTAKQPQLVKQANTRSFEQANTAKLADTNKENIQNLQEKQSTKSHGILSKRKKGQEDVKQCYQLIFTDETGNSKECTSSEFEVFKQKYPEVAEQLLNPNTIPSNEIDITNDSEEWLSVCTQILNCCWKVKGANVFHKAVDVVKFELPDYYDFVKIPMDFGSIKKKLSFNVYISAQEFINDMDLVFKNCEAYNGIVSEVGLIGVSINKEFKRLQELYGFVERFCKQQLGENLYSNDSGAKEVSEELNNSSDSITENDESSKKSSEKNEDKIEEEEISQNDLEILQENIS